MHIDPWLQENDDGWGSQPSDAMITMALFEAIKDSFEEIIN